MRGIMLWGLRGLIRTLIMRPRLDLLATLRGALFELVMSRGRGSRSLLYIETDGMNLFYYLNDVSPSSYASEIS